MLQTLRNIGSGQEKNIQPRDDVKNKQNSDNNFAIIATNQGWKVQGFELTSDKN